MKALYHWLVLLIVFAWTASCKNKVAVNKDLLQSIYHYSSSSTGFNDIKKIYTPRNQADAGFFASPSLQQMKAEIDCLVYKTIIDGSGGNTKFVFRLDSIRLLIESGEQFLNTAQLQQELSRPAIVVVSPGGKIDYLKTDTAISTVAAGFLRDIISHFQFVQPVIPSHDWQTAETNNNGLFTAHYRLLGQPGKTNTYEKINTGYSQLKKSQQKQRLIPGGSTRIVCDAVDGIRSVDSDETQVCLIGKDTISAAASKTMIAWQSTTAAANREIDQLRLLELMPGYALATTLNEDMSRDEINRLAFRQTLGNASWESLSAQFNTAGTPEKQEALILQCRALAWLSPEDCRTMGRQLQAAIYNSNTYTIISTALSQTGTALSLNLLAAAIQAREHEDSVLIDLLPALAIANNPTDQAVSVVKTVAADTGKPVPVRYTAQLALGAMALHTRKADPMKAEAITSFIRQQLALQRDTIQALLVLGNTGSTSILPQLCSYVLDVKLPSNIRAAAVSALRFIRKAEADVLLVKMQQDKNTELAAAAKEVIRFRKDYFENAG